MGTTSSKGVAILNNTQFTLTCGTSLGFTQRYENHVRPGQIFYRDPGAIWVTLFVIPTTELTKFSKKKCVDEVTRITTDTASIVNTLANTAKSVATNVAVAAAKAAKATVEDTAQQAGQVADALSLADVFQKAINDIVANAAKEASVEEGTMPITNDLLQSVQLGGTFVKETYLSKIQSTTGVFLKDFPDETMFSDKFVASLPGALKTSVLVDSIIGCYGGGNGTWLMLEGGPTFNEKTGRWEAGDFCLKKMDRETIWNKGAFTKLSYERYYTKPLERMPKKVQTPPSKFES